MAKTNRKPEPPKKVSPAAPPVQASPAPGENSSFAAIVDTAEVAVSETFEQRGLETPLTRSDMRDLAEQTASHASATHWSHIARAACMPVRDDAHRLAIRLVIGVADAMLDR